jgi:phospholipid/cholesterol/gamma-HCH transport system substrate-binding protein
VTSTLADRDQVIGDLIDNLDQVLDHVGDRDDQLSELIMTLPHLRRRARRTDREAILGSLDQISALSVETASLVSGIRKPFVDDIQPAAPLRRQPGRNKGELDRALQVLPIKLEQGRPRPRSTAPGSTSTCASSRARDAAAARRARPCRSTTRPARQVQPG